MSCNALGSLFSKLCDSFSCVFTTLCNCSQNHVLMVGDTESPIAKELMSISANNTNLTTALKTLGHKTQSKTKLVKAKPASSSSSNLDRATKEKAALLHVAHNALQQITHQDMTDEDRIVRLTTAAALAGIQNFNQSTSISDRDLKVLQQHVSLIQNYGSSAAFLWEHVVAENCTNTESLKRLLSKNIIIRGQVPILSKLFTSGQNVFQDSFCHVDLKIIAIFLRAAQLFPNKHLARQNFYSWTEPLSRGGAMAERTHSIGPNREELRQLISDLSIKKIGEDDLECPIGVKKVELLCLLNGLEDISLHRLNSDQILLLRKNIPELQRLEGAIIHLFASLKITLDPTQLKRKYLFTEDMIKTIKNEIQKNKNFEMELSKAENLSKLTINALKFLYELANTFPTASIDQFAHQYSQSYWLSSVASQSPSPKEESPPLERKSIAQLEMEKVASVMDEERARLSKNVDPETSPERMVAE